MLVSVTYRAIESSLAVLAYLPVRNYARVAFFVAIHACGCRNPGMLAYAYHGNQQDQHEE
jgi:hypothetical protein